MDIKECLNFKYNDYDKVYQKENKNLEIDEIKSILESDKKKDLIQHRKNLTKELQKKIIIVKIYFLI